MFVATALLYPFALAAVCVGAGLAVDRASGCFMPASLVVSVGAAALIALSQLTTYLAWLAPATPLLMLALALGGLAAGWVRACALVRACVACPWPALVAALAYVLALAPVLAAGRPSLSSYMALADSAVHMLGADFLIRHGQDYSHLDLRNSYGQFVHYYYGSSYPSGADTLFGGSAFLLGLPLIWAFQPFNAFMLASATGPAWLLVRRVGLERRWAAPAALTVVLPALVYAYELIASVKELTALSMLLALGALVVCHRRWLHGGPTRAIPFALVLAGGASALGLAFGAWALAAVAVLAVVLVQSFRARREAPRLGGPSTARDVRKRGRGGQARRLALLAGAGVLTLALAALPTWVDVPGALRVAQAIASTSNSGNLRSPLRVIQVLGVWLNGSYKLAPAGGDLVATHVLVALALAAALIGAVHVLRIRAYALAGWVFLTLLASLAISQSVTTWADAKTLVLSSPVAMLLVWAGISALVSAGRALPLRAVGALAALALLGGVLASDALLYHSSNLAPTARYEELASLDARFAGKGPVLFTDFDEYAMYELRNLDVGGPDFAYPPAAVAGASGGYGEPVDLDRVAPGALAAYPLIVTRRDPAASRPPSAYRLLWQGSYYQVWGRRRGAAPALAHVALTGSQAVQCDAIGRLAGRADGPEEQLVGAEAVELVRVDLARSEHPRRWGRTLTGTGEREGLVMSTPGRLWASFELPHAGVWDVWVQGEIMPTVTLGVDGRSIASIAGQLDGNSLVPDTVPPISVRLAAGRHTVTVTRQGFSLAPGEGGSAVLDAIFLTPAGADPQGPLRAAAPGAWPSLCGRRYQWVELVRSIGARP
jgi:hypothetical protein